MRDNSKDMIEIIRSFESDGHYFAVVGLVDNGVTKTFRFGVQESGYLALRTIFQTRPFDAMPGVGYRYFYTRSYYNGAGGGMQNIRIRIEASTDAKELEFDVPIELLKNIVWFAQLTDLSEANHLSEERV